MIVQRLKSSVPWIYIPFANQMRITSQLAEVLSRASRLAGGGKVQSNHLLVAIFEIGNVHIRSIIKRETGCQTIEDLKRKLDVEEPINVSRFQDTFPRSWHLKVTDIEQPIALDEELTSAFKEAEADLDLLERRQKIVSVPDIVVKIFQMNVPNLNQRSVFEIISRHVNNLRQGTPVTGVYREALLENYLI